MKTSSVATLLLLCLACTAEAKTDSASIAETFTNYFRGESARIAMQSARHPKTVAEWEAEKPKRREELLDMLGLWPMPEKTDLHPVITGKLEQVDFTVEKLHFQSQPHLYVTANLYLPKNIKGPRPTILYLCGHARVATNGISYGNKTAYQHHGAWFARNGYVCLVLDTLQLGEIEGLHHGTYREGMFWWNSRGYTPAGVEAWNNIRALDYLETRPEVDKNRIGVTGRSGGGSYSWTLAALDDRIKVAAPVAGITDLRNYVSDGCVDGHCDCMFVVNTHQWDYPQLAALIAPRPLMIGNSDKDKIFPLDGIVRLHSQVKSVYQLYHAETNLALLITEGPHADTQDLQLPVFRWFNRHLKKEDPIIEMAARKFFEPAELKVFASLPPDQINTRIQDLFVPLAKIPTVPTTQTEWMRLRKTWMSELDEKVFHGWPKNTDPGTPHEISSQMNNGLQFVEYEFLSQENVPLRLYEIRRGESESASTTHLKVLDEETWPDWNKTFHQKSAEAFQTKLRESDRSIFFFAPRGIGPNAWPGGAQGLAKFRRRFMLLGQTLDGMRVWDIRRAVQTIGKLSGVSALSVEARGNMAVNVLYASLYENGLTELKLAGMPASHREGPDYLGVLRYLDIPQATAMALEKRPITLRQTSASEWDFPMSTAQVLHWAKPFKIETGN